MSLQGVQRAEVRPGVGGALLPGTLPHQVPTEAGLQAEDGEMISSDQLDTRTQSSTIQDLQ